MDEKMAFRPTHCLIEGELDNTQLGAVTGWIRFVGVNAPVVLKLQGNFHRDIQGAKIRFKGEASPDDPDKEAYMDGFSTSQNGKVGDITAGLPPFDYGDYPYIEWYSEENGRVVLELDKDQVEVIGQPIPLEEAVPVSRQQQSENLAEFMHEVARRLVERG
ncbi:MAG: hypothetical protein RBS72_22240 [Sedimentisphaerales bacterium]|nr:hypothetical protein [Sedimentisphaerales bacterium]HOH65645.1 hypothetical protein [Sedimentisphaerales bacterium]HQA90108.1 hypothetical protein [Sedimentisphaerales bacterium]HQN35913.1 hypothetical protein [Sedimentisphaerales bacterium]